jgi:hypothetical protein
VYLTKLITYGGITRFDGINIQYYVRKILSTKRYEPYLCQVGEAPCDVTGKWSNLSTSGNLILEYKKFGQQYSLEFYFNKNNDTYLPRTLPPAETGRRRTKKGRDTSLVHDGTDFTKYALFKYRYHFVFSTINFLALGTNTLSLEVL